MLVPSASSASFSCGPIFLGQIGDFLNTPQPFYTIRSLGDPRRAGCQRRKIVARVSAMTGPPVPTIRAQGTVPHGSGDAVLPSHHCQNPTKLKPNRRTAPSPTICATEASADPGFATPRPAGARPKRREITKMSNRPISTLPADYLVGPRRLSRQGYTGAIGRNAEPPLPGRGSASPVPRRRSRRQRTIAGSITEDGALGSISWISWSGLPRWDLAARMASSISSPMSSRAFTTSI